METLIVNTKAPVKLHLIINPFQKAVTSVPKQEILTLFKETIEKDLADIKNGLLTHKPVYEWHKTEAAINAIDDHSSVELSRELMLRQGFVLAGTRDVIFDEHKFVAHAYHLQGAEADYLGSAMGWMFNGIIQFEPIS